MASDVRKADAAAPNRGMSRGPSGFKLGLMGTPQSPQSPKAPDAQRPSPRNPNTPSPSGPPPMLSRAEEFPSMSRTTSGAELRARAATLESADYDSVLKQISGTQSLRSAGLISYEAPSFTQDHSPRVRQPSPRGAQFMQSSPSANALRLQPQLDLNVGSVCIVLSDGQVLEMRDVDLKLRTFKDVWDHAKQNFTEPTMELVTKACSIFTAEVLPGKSKRAGVLTAVSHPQLSLKAWAESVKRFIVLLLPKVSHHKHATKPEESNGSMAYRQLMWSADANGTGQLSRGELRVLFLRLGLQLGDEKFDWVFEQFDADSKGHVDIGDLARHLDEANKHSNQALNQDIETILVETVTRIGSKPRPPRKSRNGWMATGTQSQLSLDESRSWCGCCKRSLRRISRMSVKVTEPKRESASCGLGVFRKS